MQYPRLQQYLKKRLLTIPSVIGVSTSKDFLIKTHTSEKVYVFQLEQKNKDYYVTSSAFPSFSNSPSYEESYLISSVTREVQIYRYKIQPILLAYAYFEVL